MLTDEIESLSLRLKCAVEERDILASKHDNEINEIRLNTKKEVDSYHELSLEFEKYQQERRNTDAREASLRDEILNLRSDLRSEQWQAEQSNERVRELRKELNCTQENLLETRDQLAKSEHLLSKVKLKFDKELETLKNNLETKEELYKKIVQEYEKLDSETKQARENSINVERAQNLKIQQLQTSFSNKVAELERTLCLLSESREENDKLKLAVADIEDPDKIDTHVLENELHTARDELTKAQSTISKNEAHIANLTDQLDEAHKLYKERIDEMNCTLFTSENDLSEGQCVISQNEYDILRMKVSLKSANDENMKLQDQISLYLSKMKSNESEARAVISELTRELETIRRECDGLSKLREGDCFSSDATINKECNVEKPEVLINFNRYEEKELERLRAYIVEFHLNQEQLQMEADQLNSSVRRQSTEKIKSLNSEIELLRSDLEAEANQTKRYFSCLENAQIEADKLNQAVRKNFSDKIYSLKKEIALLQTDKEKLLSAIDEYHDAGSQNLTNEESVLRNQVKDLHCKYVFQKERADSCATAKRQLEEQMGAVESRVLNLWKKYSKQNKKSQSTQTDAEMPRELNSPRSSSLQMELKQILQENPTAECRRDEKNPDEVKHNSENQDKQLLMELHELQSKLQDLNYSYISCQAENDALHSAILQGENDQQECLDLLQFENKSLSEKLTKSRNEINELKLLLNQASSLNSELQASFKEALAAKESSKQKVLTPSLDFHGPNIHNNKSCLTSNMLELARALLPLLSLNDNEDEECKINIEECARQALSCLQKSLMNDQCQVETPVRRPSSPIMTPLTLNSNRSFSSFSLELDGCGDVNFHREINEIFTKGEQEIQNVLDIFDDRVSKLKSIDRSHSLGSISNYSYTTSMGDQTICHKCTTLEKEYKDFRQLALSIIDDTKSATEVEVRAAILETKIETKQKIDERWRLRLFDEASRSMVVVSSDTVTSSQRCRANSV